MVGGEFSEVYDRLADCLNIRHAATELMPDC
jgi:hypothetical protein